MQISLSRWKNYTGIIIKEKTQTEKETIFMTNIFEIGSFAEVLSIQLEDRDYRLGMKRLQRMFEMPVSIVYDTVKLEKTDDSTIRFRVCMKVFDRKELMENANCVNLLNAFGIDSVYYEVEMKVTDEAMKEYYGGCYGVPYNKNTESLINETLQTLEADFNLGCFDIIFDYFTDFDIKWDVLDDKGCLYRVGEVVDRD